MYRINRIEDEERLLEEMLALQSQIREQRERSRILNTNSSVRYSKMFKPVTEAVTKLTAPPAPPPIDNLINLEDDAVVVPKEENNLINLEDDAVVVPKEEIQLDEPAGAMYKQALTSVPVRYRDDGLLGLDTINHRIGDYEYSVNGDILKVYGNDEEYEYEIDNIDLWKLLLVKNPQKVNLTIRDKETRQYLPFVERFAEIADDLHLTDTAQPGFKKRTKYQIVIDKVGSGFLFTPHPPPPNTLVIPSDDKGLMRDLFVALAELRAGNSSMRNIVVPLAQQARRKGLLPKNILSADEETWVFA